LSADGRSISGDFLISVYAVPFTLERTGDAVIAPTPQSRAVDDAFTGGWQGTLDVGGTPLPVALTIENRADGTAIGRWATEGATATPIAIVQEGPSVTLTSTVTPAAFSGILNSAGTELSGAFKQGALEQTLTFSRADAR
jgi:hypothetical protein